MAEVVHRKVSALIVENETNTCELIRSFLKPLKLFDSIVTAKSTKEAFEKINYQVFDLHIIDINLSKDDGFAVVQFIKSQKKLENSKIIIIAEKLESKKIEKAASFGIKNVICKPVEKGTFTDAVKKLMEKRSL